jgi:hypothetical protein
MDDDKNAYVARKGVVFVDGQRFPKKDSYFANPYTVKEHGLAQALDLYKKHLVALFRTNKEEFISRLRSLKNKKLGCWCDPKEKCHADILIESVKCLDVLDEKTEEKEYPVDEILQTVMPKSYHLTRDYLEGQDLEKTNTKIVKTKKELMETKNKIGQTIDSIPRNTDAERHRIWESATAWYELTKPLAARIKSEHKLPYNNVSNAFLKCVELLRFLENIDTINQSTRQEIRHFDNASLPGDFIRASEWYYGNVPIRKYDWKASSLYDKSMEPGTTTYLGDKFGLLAKNPNKWIMDEKMNGDVSKLENLREMVRRLGDWQPNLYTSDLGFHFSYDKTEEEQQLTANFGQILSGLLMLEDGGHLVTKQFTMFDDKTQWLMTTMTKLFENVHIVKPATSKTDNSECYLVAWNYKRDDKILNKIIAVFVGEKEYDPKLTKSLSKAIIGLSKAQIEKINLDIERFRKKERVDLSKQVSAWMRHYIPFIVFDRGIYDSKDAMGLVHMRPLCKSGLTKGDWYSSKYFSRMCPECTDWEAPNFIRLGKREIPSGLSMPEMIVSILLELKAFDPKNGATRATIKQKVADTYGVAISTVENKLSPALKNLENEKRVAVSDGKYHLVEKAPSLKGRSHGWM